MVQPRVRHVWVYPRGESATAGLALELRQSTRGWEVLVAYVLTTPEMRRIEEWFLASSVVPRPGEPPTPQRPGFAAYGVARERR